MKKYPFYSALVHCHEFYGLELDEDRFEEYGMSAWSHIGNKDYKIYRVTLIPCKDPESDLWVACLPCNATSIESITYDGESFPERDNVTDYAGPMIKSSIENQVEDTKFGQHRLYNPGHFINYTQLGDKIYFTYPYDHVNVLYKGLYADEDGLPYINQKEKEAIAAYCAYVNDYRKARMTKDQSEMNLAQIQKAEWKRLCSAARVPEEMSQNQMNNIIQASVSWNRASYGIDYKPIS